MARTLTIIDAGVLIRLLQIGTFMQVSNVAVKLGDCELIGPTEIVSQA